MLIRSPHQNLIGKTTEFAHTDSKEFYVVNRARMGKDWYYWDNPISYKWNNLGYRMKELEEVDYSNYVLFLGCSYVVGIGLHLEDTYAYKVSQRLGCDYVNAAVGGSSVDFALNNLVYFLKRCPQKPRAVIINWPELARTFWWVQNYHGRTDYPDFYIPQVNGATGDWDESYRDFIVNTRHQYRRFDFVRETAQLLCESKGIPLFELSTSSMMDKDFEILHRDVRKYQHCDPSVTVSNPNKYTDMIPVMHRSKARDMDGLLRAHVGIDHHQFITDDVVNYMETNNA
jgi:hypothetical protein